MEEVSGRDLVIVMFIGHSLLPSEIHKMRCAGLALAVILLICAPALAAERPPEHARVPDRVCLTAAQAREKIAQHKLAEPFRVMQAVTHRFQGEALRVKLCRRKDEFFYEISLLRRDGRVVRALVNAASGKIVKAVNAK